MNYEYQPYPVYCRNCGTKILLPDKTSIAWCNGCYKEVLNSMVIKQDYNETMEKLIKEK